MRKQRLVEIKTGNVLKVVGESIEEYNELKHLMERLIEEGRYNFGDLKIELIEI